MFFRHLAMTRLALVPIALLCAALALAGCRDRPAGGPGSGPGSRDGSADEGRSESAAVRWDLSLPWSPQSYHVANAERFARRVDRATQGRVRIAVHPGGVLGLKGPESLRALGQGVVQMAEMPGVQQIGTAPLLGLDSLPFLVETQDDLRRLDRLLRPALARTLDAHGVKLLYRVPWPNQNMFFDRPVADLEDLAGLRMRTYDRLSTALVRQLGLIPVQMPLGDVVPALAAGAIDATMTSTSSAAAQRLWAFQNQVLRTNHTWLTNIMAVDRDAWERLSATQRAAIEAAAADLEADFWAEARADDARQLARLVAAGMTVAEPAPAFRATMRAAARPIWRTYLAEMPPAPRAEARAILDRYLAATPELAPLGAPGSDRTGRRSDAGQP
ncbi:hypothetical protein CCR85_03610 [Rhodothalassium salexigens]|uniref:TRAP transporter substrate-binding protein n=1 Tax=Rhodothalassium salexigens TaxID=1086 RepID=UPI0019144699|nr:TRAP transporter substrate-binding protein [Rhodothalassium salexigens]MBK5910578.1 hypothetical protein [Rhodothalassium salexigens]